MDTTQILQIVGAVYTIANVIVGLTTTPKDDELLKRIMTFISIFQPKDSAGTFKMPFTSSK